MLARSTIYSSHTLCAEMARRYTLGKRATDMERTREAILAAARARLARVGYVALRVDDVARRARVSRRTVYAHFRSRSLLADAALDERVGALRDRVSRWRPRSSDAGAVLDEVIAFHARTYREEYALMETLSEGAPESGRRLMRELDAERLRTITRTVQSIAGQLRLAPRDASALIHTTLSYPAWRVALTGPAGRRAPRLIAAMLRAALL
jgi:AcrR family transcriptional regulator